jgi:NitT/TauT family transport system substrate-binding protein
MPDHIRQDGDRAGRLSGRYPSVKSRSFLSVGLLSIAGLIGAACGDDDDSASDSTPTTSGDEASTAESTTGPGSPAPEPLDETTSVTISPAVAIEPFAPVYLAQAMGEFERENLDVTIAELQPNDGYVAVARGEVQIQVGGVNAAFLNAVDGGTELRWLANVHQTGPDSEDGLWVRNEFIEDDGTVSADTMRDLQIAIGAGGIASTSALPVADWAEEQDVALSDLELLPLGGNDIAIALEQGSIGAGYVLSPAWITIRDSGCCTLVTPLPALAASTYTMSADFIEDQPEVADAIMRAITRTVRTYLQDDYHADDEVMTAMSEAFGVPVEGMRQTPPLEFDPDLGLDVEVLERIQTMWIDNDVLEFDEPLPLDRLTDRSVVERVVGE